MRRAPKRGRDRQVYAPTSTVNFLAHLFLAGPDSESRLGALFGDFVKGRIVDQYTPGIRAGILLHRRIDSYTDAHAVTARARQRISPARRRYAGIMLDLFFDHFLARDWAQFSDISLPRFCADVYALLEGYPGPLPGRLAYVAPRMASGDWLGAYARPGAIGDALDRMAARFKRETTLPGAGAELLAHYDSLEMDFRELFGDLRDFAGRQRVLLARP